MAQAATPAGAQAIAGLLNKLTSDLFYAKFSDNPADDLTSQIANLAHENAALRNLANTLAKAVALLTEGGAA